MKAGASAALVLLWALHTPQASQVPTFRAGTEAVLVDVAVEQHGKPVEDLQIGDFTLTDSGVPQTLLSCSRGSLPIDLMLLVDRSVSMDSRSRDVTDAAARLAATARPQDRLTTVTLDSAVREGAIDDASARAPDRRHTSLFDGLAAVLMRPAQAGMRRVVVAITDGVDTSSVLDHGIVSAIADRAGAAVYAIVISDIKKPFNLWLDEPPGRRTRLWALEEIADRAGGRVFDLSSGETLNAAVAATLGEFRSRYTLAYQPVGVPEAGWHPLNVRVTHDGRYDVRARKGYGGR
jgi:hypothetical protein